MRTFLNRDPSTSSDTDHGLRYNWVAYAPRTPELCGSDSTSHLHDAFEKKAQEGHRFTLRLRARTPRLRPVVFYSRHHRAHQREMRLCMRTTTCPSPAFDVPAPAPANFPSYLLPRPASHTCRVPGLPYVTGRLRSGRGGSSRSGTAATPEAASGSRRLPY